VLIICALRFLAQAHAALETGPEDPRRIETIPRDLQKAQNLIAELQGAIDHEAGSKVATNLDQLYDYFNRRLLEATSRRTSRGSSKSNGCCRNCATPGRKCCPGRRVTPRRPP
jgi:flagellar biosynthetic protein FliS